MNINKYGYFIKEDYKIMGNFWCKLCPLEYWNKSALNLADADEDKPVLKTYKNDKCFGFTIRNWLLRNTLFRNIEKEDMEEIKANIIKHYINHHPFEWSVLNKGKYNVN